MEITVFTPTFNRAYILKDLYDSLCEQTFKNFEWLIVDDGSTDGTQVLIQSFIEENKISIKYKKQINAGKHIAINTGAMLAQGSLFFIVDSDDSLKINALEILYNTYKPIKFDPLFCGVSGVRCSPSDVKIGGEVSWQTLDCTSDELRYKYNVKGDMAEAWKTEILKKYPFPKIDGEIFCSEVLIWSRLALKYKLRYVSDKIYICDYLADGLSVNTVSHRAHSPLYALHVYSEMAKKTDIPFSIKARALINGWRFGLCLKEHPFSISYKFLGLASLIYIPIGLSMHFKDRYYLRRIENDT